MAETASPKGKGKKSLFAFLPRLGSKEKIESSPSVPRSASKEKLNEEIASKNNFNGMPVFEDTEESKLDEDWFAIERVGGSGSSVSSNPAPRSDKPNVKTPSFRKIKHSKDKATELDNSVDMTLLQESIHGKESRRRLVEALLSLENDLSVKVRFVSAVDEYLVAEGNDKSVKAANIVKMFIKKDSMFYLSGIPPHYEHNLMARKYDSLETLRVLFLNDLARNDLVLKTVADVTSWQAPRD